MFRWRRGRCLSRSRRRRSRASLTSSWEVDSPGYTSNNVLMDCQDEVFLRVAVKDRPGFDLGTSTSLSRLLLMDAYMGRLSSLFIMMS